MVRHQPSQGAGSEDCVIFDQEDMATGLDQLSNLIVDRGNPAPPSVDAELAAFPGNVALHADALGELALLHQVAGRQEELSFAVDECQ